MHDDISAIDWLALSPAATLLLDAGGRVTWANDACRTLLAPRATLGVGLPADMALALPSAAADELRAALLQPKARIELDAGAERQPRWLQVDCCRAPGGRQMLVLSDIDALKAAQDHAARQAELLRLAQDYGRLGVWERDVRTLEGRWDRHVRRFWGLDDHMPTPDFHAATMSVVEVDRAGFQRAFRRSLRQAGTYSHRYRVTGSDGSTRHLHSQWTVKNGDDGQPSRVLGIMMDDTEAWTLARSHDDIVSQLALAVDLSGIVVWRHDLASQRVHYSDQGLGLLGIAPRPEGVPIDEVRARMHPDDLLRVQQSVDQALRTGQPSDTEVRYLLADGSQRTVLLRRVLQRDAGGKPVAFVGVALDLTQRLEESQRAGALARRFELATHTAGIGYWNLEGRAERADWSEQLRAMHGLRDGEPVPTLEQWLATIIHADDRAEVRRRFAEWVASGLSGMQAEFRILRRDGEVREVIAHSRAERSGKVPVLFGVVVDVTEHRSTALALRRTSERAALAARGAGVGTWELDLRDGRARWDEQMWRLRGRPAQLEAPAADDMLAMLHPDDRALAQRRLDESSVASATTSHEFRVVLPDGRVRWLASRSVAVHDDAGQPVRRIGVNWDITDSRTADAVRLEREIALRESQAKSKFLARMSHELRTPLNAVLGFAQLLERDDAADGGSASRRERLGHIRSAGQHLLSLINDVLELTSVEGGELPIAVQAVPLAPLVTQTLPLVDPLLRERGVTLHCGSVAGLVLADATRLRQVLLNLLSNAVKYNRSQGRVDISAERSDGQVVLRVVDTGRGLTEHQLSHLFEPFNRLGNERDGIEGTGIGLVIVKSLVERMGGSIAVTSQSGVGSVFELRLPDAQQHTAQQQDAQQPEAQQQDGRAAPAAVEPPQRGESLPPSAAAGPSAPARGATLLYIEDNPINALIVSEMVGRRPHLKLHIAVNGADGVARAHELRPDLILLDMQLPDFDGFEVLQRLRAAPATAAIPCIAVSANAMPDDIARALAAGMADYWTKPLDLPAFMAALDRLFGPADPDA